MAISKNMNFQAETASSSLWNSEGGPAAGSTQTLDADLPIGRTTHTDTTEAVTSVEWDASSMSIAASDEEPVHETKTKVISMQAVLSRVLLATALLLALHLCRRAVASRGGLALPSSIEEAEDLDPDLQQLRSTEDSLEQHVQSLRKTWAASSPNVKKAFVEYFLIQSADQPELANPLAAFERHAEATRASKPRGRNLPFNAKATYRMQLRSCDLLIRTALVRLKSLGVLERAATGARVRCTLLDLKEPPQEALTAQQNVDAVGFTDLLQMIQYQSKDLSGLKPAHRGQRVPRRLAAHLAESLRVFDLTFSQDNCLHAFVESSLHSLQTEWKLLIKAAEEEGEAAAFVPLAQHDAAQLAQLRNLVKRQRRTRLVNHDLRKIVWAWAADWSTESVVKYPAGLHAREESRLADTSKQKAAYVESFKEGGQESERKYPSLYALFVGLL